jgi:hypothetical protein
VARAFTLPPQLASAGWKLKIRDEEIGEAPHVTVIRGSLSWRYDSRDRRFMDREPPPRNVDTGIVDYINTNIAAIVTAWDAAYPANPVEPK